jgi:adenylylsulfate kinase
MKILICGLPGSGKSTIGKPFAELIGGVWINADEVRKKYDDWDFTPEGRMRQALRMKFLSDGVVMAGKIAIADFICPTKAARESFNADYTVWMDTIKFGKYEDTNLMYERLTSDEYNYHVSRWFEKAEEQLVGVVTTYMKRKIQGKNNDI